MFILTFIITDSLPIPLKMLYHMPGEERARSSRRTVTLALQQSDHRLEYFYSGEIISKLFTRMFLVSLSVCLLNFERYFC